MVSAEIVSQTNLRDKRKILKFRYNKPTVSVRYARILESRKSALGRANDYIRVREIGKFENFYLDCIAEFYGKKYLIIKIENISYDWKYYAKSYGHPKKTVDYRGISITCLTTGKEFYYSLENFGGLQNKLYDAIGAMFGLQRSKLNNLNLHEFVDVREVKNINNTKIYIRSIAGLQIGFVAVKNKTSYHGNTIRESVKGLNRKIKSMSQKTRIDYIDDKKLKSLNFCDTGIKDFWQTYGLSQKSITGEELLKLAILKFNDTKNLIVKYPKETVKLIESLGYDYKDLIKKYNLNIYV